MRAITSGTIDNILLNINDNGFDSFVRLTDVKTQEDKQRLAETGYGHGALMTLEEFRDAVGVPEFPYDKVFYTPSLNFECCYFNVDSMAIAYISTYFISLGMVPGSEYTKVIKAAEDAAASGDYSRCAAVLQGRLAIEYAQRVATEQADNVKDLYGFFMSVYNESDYGFSAIEKPVLDRVISAKTSVQAEETAQALMAFPDIITVYRGGGSKSAASNQAYSWTTDINVANFFAARRGMDTGYIAKGWVYKKDIIEVFLDRGESEVMVDPNNVKDVQVTPVYGIGLCEMYYPRIMDLYHRYSRKIDDLHFAQNSDIHDRRHEKRVLLMALLIAELKGLPTSDKRILAEAAAYHDCMRLNDDVDSSHGAAAKEEYERTTKPSDPLVGFLCEYHCRSDADGYHEIETNRTLSKIGDRAKLLLDIFKDADALDRVRFGVKGIDMSLLRTSASKSLSLVARINLEQIL